MKEYTGSEQQKPGRLSIVCMPCNWEYTGYQKYNGHVVKLTTHLHLVLRLITKGPIPSFPPYVLMVCQWTILHYKTVTKFWSYHLLIQLSAEWTNTIQSMTNFLHSAGYRFVKALARIGGLAAEPAELVQTSSVYRLVSRVPKSPLTASPLNAFKKSSVPLKICSPESYFTLHLYEQSRDSSVGIMIRLWDGQPRKARFDFRQKKKSKWFSSFPMCPRRMLGPSTLLFKG